MRKRRVLGGLLIGEWRRDGIEIGAWKREENKHSPGFKWDLRSFAER